jgi:D-3-phosphoglycerate dehydrogenase
MKILIADKLSDQVRAALEQLGFDVIFQPDLTADTLPGAIADASVLVVRSTRVTAETFAAGAQLSLVIRAGAGVNTIDLPEASRRGVYVANCPGRNTAAVAELAIGLLICADRRIADASTALRDGKWRKKEFGKARGLKGRTLGILGFGSIGKAVAKRALGLDMHVAAWSRSLTAELAEAHGVSHAQSPLALASQVDALSVHLALKPETQHLVGAELLSALPDGAILVNTSRGELVDAVALKDAIRSKGLRVGLDVYCDEPTRGEDVFADQELASMVTGTPHIGASTDEAADAIAAQVVRIVKEFLETGHASAAVNLCQRSAATHHLVVRHYNRIGVLAGVLDELRAEGVNVEEMANAIFDGAAAACCTLQLDQPPSTALIERLRGDANVLDVLLQVNP